VNTSCGGNKENEGHDMCMAAAGFLFLALKIQKISCFFFGEANNGRK
jgi:hypothetical protein